MNYSQLRKELLVHLRGKIPQEQVNKKLGLTFNKVYRWESGTDHLMWPDFVKLGKVFKINIEGIVKEVFTFHDDPKKSHLLVKHFAGTTTQVELAKILGISRYTLSRWLKGTSHPQLEQMFALMDFVSPEFLRFLEAITKGVVLQSTQERILQNRSQSGFYSDYPWLSTLLSAIETTSYRSHPSDKTLAKKTKLPLEDVQKALDDFSKAGIIEWNGKHWETKLNRIFLKASPDDILKIAKYVFSTTFQSIEHSKGNKEMRLSWKIFSLNKNAYGKILQRYTEFFRR